MAQPRNKAVIAGLAAALTLGGVTLPAMATTSNSTPTTDSDSNGMGTPLPGDYDRADYYEGTEGVSTFASSRSASSLAPVALSDEMKYFTLYESGRNYDKGLSSGDGYNAVGYYQFDRRYALVPFLQQVYAYDSQTYAMFSPVLAQAATLASKSYSMYDYDTRQLTALAQQLDAAWHAAYAANPAEFSALQDSYAYNNYYLPVQSTLLNTYGVDLRNRADCVKGLAWSMCNLFGQLGVQNFFKGANLSNDMTDHELVTALCDTVVDRVAELYPSQPQYHKGWQNRFRKEKATCLKYIEQHEAEQATGGQQGDASNVDSPSAGVPEANGPGAGDAGFGATGSEPDSDVPNAEGETSSGGSQQPATPQAGGGSSSDSSAESDAANGSADSSESGPSANSGQQDGSAGDGPVDGAVTPPTGDGGSVSDGAAGAGPSGDDTDSTGDSSESGDVPSGSASSDDASAEDTAVEGEGESAEKGAAADDGSKSGSTGSADDADAATRTKGSDATAKATVGDLPVTGDDIALVMTGAVGLSVAGASFLSLAKKEKDVE